MADEHGVPGNVNCIMIVSFQSRVSEPKLHRIYLISPSFPICQERTCIFVFSMSSFWFHACMLNVELFDLSVIYLGVCEMVGGLILFFKL